MAQQREQLQASGPACDVRLRDLEGRSDRLRSGGSSSSSGIEPLRGRPPEPTAAQDADALEKQARRRHAELRARGQDVAFRQDSRQQLSSFLESAEETSSSDALADRSPRPVERDGHRLDRPVNRHRARMERAGEP